MRSRSLTLTAKSSMELVALPRPFAQLQKSSVGLFWNFIHGWSVAFNFNVVAMQLLLNQHQITSKEIDEIWNQSSPQVVCRWFKMFQANFSYLLISASFLLTTCSWSTRYWKPSSELWEGLRQTERDKKVSPEGVHLFYHTEFHTGLAW